MKVKPLRNHLLIKLQDKENVTKNNIILAGLTVAEINIALVIETSDNYDDNLDILVKGDRILINPHIGISVKINNEEHFIIDQKEVLAVLRF